MNHKFTEAESDQLLQEWCGDASLTGSKLYSFTLEIIHHFDKSRWSVMYEFPNEGIIYGTSQEATDYLVQILADVGENPTIKDVIYWLGA